MKSKTLGVATALFISGANAGQYCNESTLDGVTLEDQKKLVVSVYNHTVSIPDPTGLRKARIIAQERAKAEIVRYFNQFQIASRTVIEDDSTSGETTRLVDGSGAATSSIFTRSQSETLTQIDQSIASGGLRGVVQVDESYDATTQTLCVAMGFSAKTAAGARDALEWMNGSTATSADEKAAHEVSGIEDADAIKSYSRQAKDIQ